MRSVYRIDTQEKGWLASLASTREESRIVNPQRGVTSNSAALLVGALRLRDLLNDELDLLGLLHPLFHRLRR